MVSGSLRCAAHLESRSRDLEVRWSFGLYLPHTSLPSLKDKLSEHLSNSRAIESLLRDAFIGIKVRSVDLFLAYV